MKKIIIAGVVAALGFTTSVWADTALVIGSYSNSPDSVKSRLEAAGHTATVVSSKPADISGYDQIWDLRWDQPFDQTTVDEYDAFVKDGGFLFFSTENPGCCSGYNETKAALITQMGGGDTVIGGGAGSTENQVVNGTNTTYMTNGLTVNFMAISAIENDQGTALITDANGKVAAMMWVGNAGDLGTGYTGTVITIADINWLAQGFTDPNMSEDNTQALDDIIRGVVAGTVAGTISDTGNGEGSDVGGEPVTPEVTVTGTEAGDPIVVINTNNGGTVTTVTTVHGVSETDTEQTVETTVTTALTTATVTQTCTTTTTITNYSDGSSSDAVANNDENCTSTTEYDTTSSATVDTVSGRIDQSATVQDITSINIRNLEFNGLNGMVSDHNYANGMEGSTRGFTLGGKNDLENGITIGGGLAQFSTNIKDANENKAGASTTVLVGSIEKNNVEFSVRHGMTDYTASRNIGPYSNAMSTRGTDTSASVMFRPETDNEFHPVIGYTRGNRTMDAYTETGDSLTARSVAESSEMYGYATIGGTLDFGVLDITGLHHTDGVNVLGLNVNKEWEKDKTFTLSVNRSMSDLGNTNSIGAGIQIKF